MIVARKEHKLRRKPRSGSWKILVSKVHLEDRKARSRVVSNEAEIK